MTPNEIHDAIMNLPCDGNEFYEANLGIVAYNTGHWDARQAAARLVMSAFDLDTQCKIAFAEMELAWMRRTPGEASQKTLDTYWLCHNGYLFFNERNLDDMRRVTRELTSK